MSDGGGKEISESSVSFLNVRLFCITRWSVSLSSLVDDVYLSTLTTYFLFLRYSSIVYTIFLRLLLERSSD